MNLKEALNMIVPTDNIAVEFAKRRLDNLTKPLGSLGKLEEIIQRLSSIYRSTDFDISKKAVIIMCADNGVFEEGVSSCPKEVTSSVTQNFMKGITGINVLAQFAKADIVVVDIGVDDDLSSIEGIINRKIRRGTWNIAKGPAMTREEAEKAIEVGIEMACSLKENGYMVLATGEMGICNTTTSSAIASVLTGMTPSQVVGKGSGLSDEGYSNKVRVVERAIKVNSPNSEDPIDILAKVGGFDIAGLVGCYLGAAAVRLPILIDGFISSVAALTAVRINPLVKEYIFPSHCSAEPGARIVLEALGLEEMLNLNMRLGEGTGAAVAFNLFDMAVSTYYRMGTFQDANIEKYIPQD